MKRHRIVIHKGILRKVAEAWIYEATFVTQLQIEFCSEQSSNDLFKRSTEETQPPFGGRYEKKERVRTNRRRIAVNETTQTLLRRFLLSGPLNLLHRVSLPLSVFQCIFISKTFRIFDFQLSISQRENKLGSLFG